MADREINRSALSVNRETEQRAAEGPTLLAREDVFEGSLRLEGDGTVLGQFEGEIECTGELLIGREADVTANIRTVNLTISGRVQGNIVVTGRLRITATGRLEGDARVGALVVQEGGVHLGMIKVHPEGVPLEDQRGPLLGPRTRPEAQPALQSARVEAPQQALPEAAQAEFGDEGDPAQSKGVDRVKKLWGEFF